MGLRIHTTTPLSGSQHSPIAVTPNAAEDFRQTIQALNETLAACTSGASAADHLAAQVKLLRSEDELHLDRVRRLLRELRPPS